MFIEPVVFPVFFGTIFSPIGSDTGAMVTPKSVKDCRRLIVISQHENLFAKKNAARRQRRTAKQQLKSCIDFDCATLTPRRSDMDYLS